MEPNGPQFVNLQNYETGHVQQDRLFPKAQYGPCKGRKVCTASHMTPMRDEPGSVYTKEQVLQQAGEFIQQFYESQKKLNSNEHLSRWSAIKEEVEKRASYSLTEEELSFGARMAWRNAPRCIGRIQWTNLKVFDARHVRTAKEMFEHLLEHIQYATNGGNLRSTITIFPQRTDGKHDFRLWNSQLVSYAGYLNDDGTVTGDPINVEFTQICEKLGWKGKKTTFDILPLVLQANGQDPQVFEIPENIILQVPIAHPKYPRLQEMNLRWYALPAVASMLFDCGGIKFPAAPFNGWYMATEIAARDLCDPQRYNLTRAVAEKLGLETDNDSTLWKDTVVLELNKAVLHSYQKQGVTIWDHHKASESFIQHFNSEIRTRGGCPADWIWLVPPMTSSLSPVFHQEMAYYFLKPSYEYQIPAWKTHPMVTDKQELQSKGTQLTSGRSMRKAICSVRFVVSLYLKCLKKRPKITVLYASESGKAEKYARTLTATLNKLFCVQIYCVADYDTKQLSSENILLLVASTAGNGDPPVNGVDFRNSLLKLKEKKTSDPVFQNVKFAVLGLGSTAYINFCAFGKFLDGTLNEMGATCLMPLTCADELKGQEHTFQTWMKRVFTLLCQQFLKMDDVQSLGYFGQTDKIDQNEIHRFVTVNDKEDLMAALNWAHKKPICLTRVARKSVVKNKQTEHSVLILALDTFGSEKLRYEPGDHIAIFPRNQEDVVNYLLQRFSNGPPGNAVLQLESRSKDKEWGASSKFPCCSLRTLLTRIVDLNSPPSQDLLRLLANCSKDDKDKKNLNRLAENGEEYNEWVSWNVPGIVDVLKEFPSIQIEAAQLVAHLPLLQHRYYSISSCNDLFPSEIHITVRELRYHVQGGKGSLRRGVCSSFLQDVKEGEFIPCFLRTAPYFHLPKDPIRPVILIAAGTGIAPFRGFWQKRFLQTRSASSSVLKGTHSVFSSTNEIFPDYRKQRLCGHGSVDDVSDYGPLVLYYGCREKSTQLYKKEISLMTHFGAISDVHVSYSRESKKKKNYVQHLLMENGAEVCRYILERRAQIYVCGSAVMAASVEEALRNIVAKFSGMQEDQVKYVFDIIKDEERYHVDVFGSHSSE